VVEEGKKECPTVNKKILERLTKTHGMTVRSKMKTSASMMSQSTRSVKKKINILKKKIFRTKMTLSRI